MRAKEKGFVNIETFYHDEHDRNICELSKIYENPVLLKTKIQKIGKGILDNDLIIKDRRILLKPNWVLNNLKENDNICLRTNEAIIIALIEILIEKKPEIITIGDAPIQGCSWGKLLNKEFFDHINELSLKYDVPINIKDFRRVTFDPKANVLQTNRHHLSEYIIFDIGEESFLEPISTVKNIFRVTDYNPERLSASHKKGMHKYCITKEIFDADLIISLPKIKTHQKTGITGALKNIVGVNGDKDYLPHHRVGGSESGGDCYPGKNKLRRLSEYLLDNANRKQGKFSYLIWYWLSIIIWRISKPEKVHNTAAAWYGNDTCWRMVMDLNKIVVYGKKDGKISREIQRTLYSLCDGIIGGQGNGPLNPDPLPLGIISFTNNSAMNDICMAVLMGFDTNKIPLLREAYAEIRNQEINIQLNDASVKLNDLYLESISTAPPPGWINYL